MEPTSYHTEVITFGVLVSRMLITFSPLANVRCLNAMGGTVGALRAMRTNEKLTNRSYDKALDFYMPPLGQAIVLENLKDERRHLATIEAHLERLTGKQYYDVDRIEREGSERPYAP